MKKLMGWDHSEHKICTSQNNIEVHLGEVASVDELGSLSDRMISLSSRDLNLIPSQDDIIVHVNHITIGELAIGCNVCF
jgi:hypothetical protein